MQLNRPGQIGSGFHALTREFCELEFILQTPTPELIDTAAGVALCCRPGRVAALYDPSGGRGIFPRVYPYTPMGFHVGFAGGIGPDNVLDVINRLGPRVDPYWLCMESGVRTDEQFDLTKVEAVASKVGEYIARETRRRQTGGPMPSPRRAPDPQR